MQPDTIEGTSLQMRKTGARTGVMGLLAVVLAVIVGLSGISWGQGMQSQGRYADSPHQADKSFTVDRQKKRQQQQIQKKVQKPQTQQKGRPSVKGPASQSRPPTKPMRSGPLGPSGQ